MKKIIKIIALALAAVLVIGIGFVCAQLFIAYPGGGNASKSKYANWMAENVKHNAKLVDVAMLGAHDAFSYTINAKSKLDVLSADDIFKGGLGKVAKNMLVRISRTQSNGVKELLEGGVRYLDIRLSYDAEDGQWHVTHNYLGGVFKDLLGDIKAFLDANKGEVLIFDFQHVFDPREGGLEAGGFDEIRSMLEASGLLGFAYDFKSAELKNITYGQLTQNGTKSAVVMLIKHKSGDTRFLDYGESIRSIWFNTPDRAKVLSGIETECAFITANAAEKEKLRVMQAVVTLGDAVGIIKGWSIIAASKKLNALLTNQAKFDSYLSSLPIVMVDCAITKSGGFHDKVMQKIIEFNKKA